MHAGRERKTGDIRRGDQSNVAIADTDRHMVKNREEEADKKVLK